MHQHPTPLSERQRRLLGDMGIEVWYLRGPGRAKAVVPTRGVSPTPPPDSRTTAALIDKAHQSADASPASDARRETLGAPSETGASTAPPSPQQPAPATDAPYAVVALGAPGILLVVEHSTNRGDAILARDIVWAACGDWTPPVRQARFDWPQPGATGSSAPVLAAFIEKQAEDHGAQRVLVTASTARRLDANAEHFIEIPDLSSLADGEAKSALWQRVRG